MPDGQVDSQAAETIGKGAHEIWLVVDCDALERGRWKIVGRWENDLSERERHDEADGLVLLN